jgi:hypothetical protein
VQPFSFVSMGGSETEGDGLTDRLREAWPYVFFHNALPRETTFVNAAVDDAELARALADQVPLVEEMHPRVVALFLGVDDLWAQTPIATFTDQMNALLARLERAGVEHVLVGDIPDAYGSEATRYNTAIRAAINTHHAVQVPLHNAQVSVARIGSLIPTPDTAGQRIIADAFANAYQRAT